MSLLGNNKTAEIFRDTITYNFSNYNTEFYSPVQNKVETTEKREEFQDCFLNFLKNQSKTENYVAYQNTAFLLRGHLLGWLQILNDKLEYSSQTIFRAIVIFDKFLEKNKNTIEKDKIQLYAASCYFLSIKLEEVNCISLEFLRKDILKEKFPKELIIKTELEILKVLNFKLQFPTIQNFSDVYMLYIKVSKEFLHLFNQMYYFVNIMSQFVDEFIFNTEPSRLSIINLQTTLLILEEVEIFRITEKENNHLNQNLYTLIMELGKEEQKEILQISGELKEAIFGQVNHGKRKVFFDIYQNCLNEFCNYYEKFI